MSLVFGVPGRRRNSPSANRLYVGLNTIEIVKPVEEGKYSKLILSPESIETLGFDMESDVVQKASFSFTEGKVYILNSTTMGDIADRDRIRVAKNGSITSKATIDHIETFHGAGHYELVPVAAHAGVFEFAVIAEGEQASQASEQVVNDAPPASNPEVEQEGPANDPAVMSSSPKPAEKLEIEGPTDDLEPTPTPTIIDNMDAINDDLGAQPEEAAW